MSPRSASPLNLKEATMEEAVRSVKPREDIAYVRWIDSSVHQDQRDDLPTPTVLHSVGWVAQESTESMTLVRDQIPDPGSYRWRASLSIPASAILEVIRLGPGSTANPA